VVDLGDGKVALLAQVAEHVSLALQVRLAISVYLGDERGAVLQLGFIDLSDTTAAHRAGTPQALAERTLDAFGDDSLSHFP
jgi:hypothetical protein